MNVFGRRRQPQPLEHLDAYLDGALSAAERQTFEQALGASPELQQALTARRELKALVAAAPELEAPRSFRITADMIAAPAKPVSSPSGGRYQPAFTLVRAGAALSMLVFAVLVGADLVTSGNGADSDDEMRTTSLAASAGGNENFTKNAADSAAPAAVVPQPASGAAATAASGSTSGGGSPESTSLAGGLSPQATPAADDGSADRSADEAPPSSAPSPELAPVQSSEELTSAYAARESTARDDDGPSPLRMAQATAGVLALGLATSWFVIRRRRSAL
ncbi:hypothetical protein AYO38_09525 [bacterium SCGC AG-212-C10]|nr:hypothetical protein AYO38_09525 [bacterium SCGC AG-212-C10]